MKEKHKKKFEVMLLCLIKSLAVIISLDSFFCNRGNILREINGLIKLLKAIIIYFSDHCFYRHLFYNVRR